MVAAKMGWRNAPEICIHWPGGLRLNYCTVIMRTADSSILILKTKTNSLILTLIFLDQSVFFLSSSPPPPPNLCRTLENTFFAGGGKIEREQGLQTGDKLLCIKEALVHLKIRLPNWLLVEEQLFLI